MPISRRNKPRKTTRCPACAGTGYIDRKQTKSCRFCNGAKTVSEDRAMQWYRFLHNKFAVI